MFPITTAQVSDVKSHGIAGDERKPVGFGSALSVNKKLQIVRLSNAISLAILLGCIAVWLAPARVPLWVDETISYWQINAGLRHLWERQEVTFVAYPFLLWLTKTIFGSSVIALRAPSILAMVAALWVMYRIAREFFDRNLSLLVTIVFACYPPVIFAAIDARPYALAVLAVSIAILMLLRSRRSGLTRDAVLFGGACALIAYFHYLLAVVLIPLALLWMIGNNKNYRQLLFAVGTFLLLMLPLVPRFFFMMETRQTHIYDAAPNFAELSEAFAPYLTLLVFLVIAPVAAVCRVLNDPKDETPFTKTACLLLGCVPILLLYGISQSTSLHVFLPRYRLAAAPGIALRWGLLFARIQSPILRTLFCAALLIAIAQQQIPSPSHFHSWKHAVEIANSNTPDNAPILMCSDIVEADYQPIPENPKESLLFAPLSYYPVHSPVVPLPRSLGPAAKAEVDRFCKPLFPATSDSW